MTSSDDETGRKEANSFHLSRLAHMARALYFRYNWKFEVNERDGNFANYRCRTGGTEAEHDSQSDARRVRPWCLIIPRLSFDSPSSIVIRIQRRRAVIEKMFCAQGRRDRMKLERCLAEVETVGKIVGRGVGVTLARED